MTWFIVTRVGLGLEDLRALGLRDWTPEPRLLAASSVLLLTAYFVSGGIWGRIVQDLGGPRIPITQAVPLFMIANLGRYVPGKLWQVAGLAALAKGRGIPVATATGAAILGQGIAIVAASAVGVFALVTGPARYAPWGVAVATLIGVGVLLGSIPAVFRKAADLWFRLARSEPPPGLGAVHGLRWLALYVLNWLLYALAFWLLTRSFDLHGALIPVASAFAAAYVIGYAMLFAPAGLGPREGFLIIFLTPQIGAAASGMIAIVARLWTTLIEVVPAGVFWVRHVAEGRRPEADDPGRREGPGLRGDVP